MKKITLAIIIILSLTVSNVYAQSTTELPANVADAARRHFTRWQAWQEWGGVKFAPRGVPFYDVYDDLTGYIMPVGNAGYMVIATDGRLWELANGEHRVFTDPVLTGCGGHIVRDAPFSYLCYHEEKLVNTAQKEVTLNLPAARVDSETSYRALGGFSIMSTGSGYVSDVPDMNQFINFHGCWSGCGPTSAAMVLKYWDAQGFDGLHDTDDATRVNDLAGKMGSWCESGMTFSTVASVREILEQETVQQNHAVTVEIEYQATFQQYQDEIDAGNPPVVFFNRSGEYGNHFATGVGYQDDYFILHDNRSPTGDALLNSTTDGYDYIHLVTYEIAENPSVNNTEPVPVGLPRCEAITLTIPNATYTISYDIDSFSAPITMYFQKNIGIGLGCGGAFTDCVITDNNTIGGIGGVFVEVSPTGGISESFYNAVYITDTANITDVCVDAVGGAVGEPEYLMMGNLALDYGDVITQGRCITCCRNEDPELYDSAAWEGDATFGGGVVTLTNDAVITTTTQFVRNSDFDTPPSLIQQVFDWQAQWSPGQYQLGATGMVWQTGRLAAGTYTMTARAKAVNTYSTRFGFTLWGWTNYHNHEFTITNTETFTDYVYAFTITTDTYNVMVYMPFGVTGNVILDSVTLERADSQTLRLSQLLYQNVYIPQYALSRLTIIARAASAGTKLQAHVDGRFVGQASLLTTWYTYTDFIFTNDLAGTRDVVINFYSASAGETVEIDYICLSHDGEECIPYAQGGPRNPSFTEHETGPGGEQPLYWDTNPDAWHTKWITTSEALFPDTAPWGEIAPYLEQLSSKYYFPNLRVTYAARLPDGVTGTIGTVDSWWSYQGRDFPGVYPRIGGAECTVSSSDRAECSYTIGIDGAYASLGDYYLHFNIPPRLSSSDPTPIALIIDDVCVQVDEPVPYSTATPIPTGEQGAPNSTPEPTASRTPMNTPLPTYTTGPGTPTRTPDATRVYPTFTPMATYTAQPTHTPGATSTSPAAPTDVPGTATTTPTSLDTPTAYPTAAPQPTVDDLVDEECCTYCIYYNRETETIEEAGSISCAGCDNCVLPDTPSAPEASIRDFFSVDFWAGWFWWVVSWIGWVGNLIAWLVCKGYYRWICPIICLIQTWAKFFWYSLQTWLGLPYDIWNYLLDNVLPALREWWDAIKELISAFLNMFDQLREIAVFMVRNCCCAPVFALLGFLRAFLHQSDHCAVALQPTPAPGTPTWTPTPTEISGRPRIVATTGTPLPTLMWEGPTPTLIPCETPFLVEEFLIPDNCANPTSVGSQVWCFVVAGMMALQNFPIINIITVWAARISAWGLFTFYAIRRVQNLINKNWR